MNLPEYLKAIEDSIRHYNDSAKTTWLIRPDILSIKLRIEINDVTWFINCTDGKVLCYQYNTDTEVVSFNNDDWLIIGLLFGKESCIITDMNMTYE